MTLVFLIVMIKNVVPNRNGEINMKLSIIKNKVIHALPEIQPEAHKVDDSTIVYVKSKLKFSSTVNNKTFDRSKPRSNK